MKPSRIITKINRQVYRFTIGSSRNWQLLTHGQFLFRPSVAKREEGVPRAGFVTFLAFVYHRDVPLYSDIIRKKLDEKKRFRFNEIETLENSNDDDPVIKLFSLFDPCSCSRNDATRHPCEPNLITLIATLLESEKTGRKEFCSMETAISNVVVPTSSVPREF